MPLRKVKGRLGTLTAGNPAIGVVVVRVEVRDFGCVQREKGRKVRGAFWSVKKEGEGLPRKKVPMKGRPRVHIVGKVRGRGRECLRFERSVSTDLKPHSNHHLKKTGTGKVVVGNSLIG